MNQQTDFVHIPVFYRAIPGVVVVSLSFSIGAIDGIPIPARVFFAITGFVTMVLLFVAFAYETKCQNSKHKEEMAKLKAERQTIEYKNELLFEQPQPVEPHKDIALGAPPNAPVAVNGYTERDWEYIVNRLLTVGHAKSKWVGVVTLPSGKTIATFESYDAMLQPFIVGQAIYGRSERESGLLIVRDPKALMMMAMTQLPSPSDLAHLNLVPKTRPNQ